MSLEIINVVAFPIVMETAYFYFVVIPISYYF